MFASSKVIRKSTSNANLDNTNTNISGQPPSSDELDDVIEAITSELSRSSKANDVNNQLWTAVAKNIAKTVRYPPCISQVYETRFIEFTGNHYININYF